MAEPKATAREKETRDRYHWRVVICLLKQYGWTNASIGKEIGVSATVAGRYGSHFIPKSCKNRPAVGCIRLIELAKKEIPEHKFRFCVKLEYEKE